MSVDHVQRVQTVDPRCYQCHQPVARITPQQWSRHSGQPLDRSGAFPLHLALFWWCDTCDITGARLVAL